MTFKKKIALILLVIPIVAGACLAGMILYYYHHPSKIKGLVERSVSASTGALCEIDHLSYSLKPMSVEAKGIVLRPGEKQKGFLLEIPDLAAEIRLAGRFGDKSLCLNMLKIDRFSARVLSDMVLSETERDESGPSLINRAARRMVSFLLFKEVKFETAEVDNGTVVFESVDHTIHVDKIRATLSSGKPVKISCTTQMEWPVKKIRFEASRVIVETDQAISLVSPRIKGHAKVLEATLASPHFDVDTIALETTCDYDHLNKHLSFNPMDMHFAGTKFKGDMARKSMPKELRFTASGSFDLKENRLDLSPFALDAKDFLELTGALNAVTGPEDKITLTSDLSSSLLKNLKLSLSLDKEQREISLKGQDIALLGSLAALKWLPENWTFRGVESIDMKAVHSKDEVWTMSGRMDLREVSFESPNAVHMGEGLVATVKTNGDFDLKRSRIKAKASLQVGGGEVLCDKFYADLRTNGFSGSCEGYYDLAKKSIRVSDVRLALKDVLAVNGTGALVLNTVPRADLSIRVKETPLKPVFDVFLLEPFQSQNPLLSSLNVDGSISAAVKFKGTQTDWTAQGNCRWIDGVFSSEDKGFSLQGIDLDLPIWYESKKQGAGDTVKKGALSIRSTTLPMLPEQAVRVPLDALPNQLAISSPTNLKIPGGELLIGTVVGEDIHSSQRTIETSLTIEEVQLEPLLSNIWPQPVKGTIKGKLDSIRLEGDRIRSEGEIHVDAFNGEILLSGFGVSGIFDPGPVVRLNAHWDNMSLARLTSGTGFGRIEGVLRGHANGLEIAYGEPQAFDLLLETVERSGGPQKVSVKAVENISQLGGGQSPFMGVAGAFASIFKEFPYKKIGIRASLANDVFRINGTIREGGTEYLIKRGGISGVNVVNQNPDNRVSFKDMVKRIKRVTAGGGGPVVK